MKPTLCTITALLSGGFLLACSASPSGGSRVTDDLPTTGGAGSGGQTGTVNFGTGGSSVKFEGSGGQDASAGRQGCATSSQESELTPIYQVFVYDRSGSMGDDPNGQWKNQSLRWEPMKQGMIDYFTNSAQVGVQASLEFFPAPGNKQQTCQANYADPAVPLTSLATPAPLVSALNTASPSGGTPTLPALIGAIEYAKQLQVKMPSAKAMVVLVTDGEPAIYNADTQQIETDCAPAGSTLKNTISDIAGVVDAAHRATPPISTYVIGVGTGDSLNSLSAIATAGGTELIHIDPVDPTKTRDKLTSTLQSIRAKHFSCDVPLPAAPEGQALNLSLVNVDFLRSSGQTDQLLRSDDCTAAGWHYDDATRATKIVLCPAACSAIQSDTAGKISLVLGCESRIR